MDTEDSALLRITSSVDAVLRAAAELEAALQRGRAELTFSRLRFGGASTGGASLCYAPSLIEPLSAVRLAAGSPDARPLTASTAGTSSSTAGTTSTEARPDSVLLLTDADALRARCRGRHARAASSDDDSSDDDERAGRILPASTGKESTQNATLRQRRRGVSAGIAGSAAASATASGGAAAASSKGPSDAGAGAGAGTGAGGKDSGASERSEGSAAADSKPGGAAAAADPLTWFGVSASPSIAASQRHFKAALAAAVRLVNLRAALAATAERDSDKLRFCSSAGGGAGAGAAAALPTASSSGETASVE